MIIEKITNFETPSKFVKIEKLLFEENRSSLSKDEVFDALKKHNNNNVRTAKELKVSEFTIHRIKKHFLKRK